jgi:hypothetical protein
MKPIKEPLTKKHSKVPMAAGMEDDHLINRVPLNMKLAAIVKRIKDNPTLRLSGHLSCKTCLFNPIRSNRNEIISNVVHIIRVNK